MGKYTSTTVRDLQNEPLRDEYVGLVLLTDQGISTKYVRNYDAGHHGVIRAYKGAFGHVFLHTEVFARDYKPGRVIDEKLTHVSCPPTSPFSEDDHANALRRNDLIGPWNARQRKKKSKASPITIEQANEEELARRDFESARRGISPKDLIAD